MDISSKSRIRTRNFTMREKRLLLSLIKKHAMVIENKRTDSATVQEKHDAWSKIETEFNHYVDEKRCISHLKSCYKNMAIRAAKNKSCENNAEIWEIIKGLKSTKNYIKVEVDDVDENQDTNVRLLSSTTNSSADFVEENNDVTNKESKEQTPPFEFIQERICNVDQSVWNEGESLDTNEDYHNLQISLLKEKHNFEMSLVKEKHELELQFAREKHMKEIELLDLKLSLTRRALV